MKSAVRKRYWSNRDIVLVGTFAALIKIVSFIVSISGGGMNPLAFFFKNLLATALLTVLVFQVRKFGVLTYFSVVSVLLQWLMSPSATMIPGLLVGGLVADVVIQLFGGYKRSLSIWFGIFFYETFTRFFSLLVNYLMIRENPAMFWIGAAIVGIGYLGCVVGIPFGLIFCRELRHAGVIKE